MPLNKETKHIKTPKMFIEEDLVRFYGISTLAPYLISNPLYMSWFPRGVMVKAIDCEIVVSEFVLQSRYYVHFRANTLGKGMNLLILPAMG